MGKVDTAGPEIAFTADAEDEEEDEEIEAEPGE